jgi:DNA-binding transcriptional ArsR family regulator
MSSHSGIFFVADVIFDLFGLPVRPRREGRGRPEHEWTKENSNKINLLMAVGHEIKDIAAAIGVSAPTLRKHYFSELDGLRVAALRLTAHQLFRLNREAEAGNVAAEKALLAFTDRERTKIASDRVAARSDGPDPKLGKKAERAEEAKRVGGIFAPRSAPAALSLPTDPNLLN